MECLFDQENLRNNGACACWINSVCVALLSHSLSPVAINVHERHVQDAARAAALSRLQEIHARVTFGTLHMLDWKDVYHDLWPAGNPATKYGVFGMPGQTFDTLMSTIFRCAYGALEFTFSAPTGSDIQPPRAAKAFVASFRYSTSVRDVLPEVFCAVRGFECISCVVSEPNHFVAFLRVKQDQWIKYDGLQDATLTLYSSRDIARASSAVVLGRRGLWLVFVKHT
jgi:hypothetical protein